MYSFDIKVNRFDILSVKIKTGVADPGGVVPDPRKPAPDPPNVHKKTGSGPGSDSRKRLWYYVCSFLMHSQCRICSCIF